MNKGSKKDKKFEGRGGSLYRAVTLCPIKNKDIAEKAGFKENTLYNHFNNPELSYAILAKYGRVISYDFTIEYPEMSEYFSSNSFMEIKEELSYSQLKQSYEILSNKYTKLLETNNALLSKYNDMMDRLIESGEKA